MSKTELSIAVVALYYCLIAVTGYSILVISPGYGHMYIYLVNSAPWMDNEWWNLVKSYPGWWIFYAWNWLLFISVVVSLFVINTRCGKRYWNSVINRFRLV